MKRTKILIAIFLIITGHILAQDTYKHSLSGVKQIRIEANTSLKLVAGGSNELVLSKYKGSDEDDCGNCGHDHYNEAHDRSDKKDKAKGLKAIYPGGTDNTGFGIEIKKDGEILRVRDLKSFIHRHGLSLMIPKNIDIHVDCGNLGKAVIEGFSSEIEVNTNVGSINLTNVTGPITAHTSTGGINVEFSNVNQASPISISSSTGDVDVSLPATTKASLELKSTMGTVYTDFDLKVPKKDGLSKVGPMRRIESQLNSGGVKITLRSSTGDIYLRKSKN